MFEGATCSNAGCITVEANLRPNVDFSGAFCVDFFGVFWFVNFLLSRFSRLLIERSGVCVDRSGVLMERDTVRIVDCRESSRRRVDFVGVERASLDTFRGLTVRFLSSVLVTSIRRRAYINFARDLPLARQFV